MRDCGVASGGQLLLAETLGLAMARRAAEILDRHRAALTAGVLDSGASVAGGTIDGGTIDGGRGEGGTIDGGGGDASDDAEFEADNAIFTAVLDAANECLGRYDTRPADDRWCDALLHLILLAQLSPAGPPPFTPRCP